MEVNLAELLKNAEQDFSTKSLNEDQELELASNELLFKVFYLTIQGRSLKEITDQLKVNEAQTQGCLIRLDQLSLIELHPEDRIVSLFKKNVRWLPDGPLNQKHGQEIRHDFIPLPC